MPHDKNGAEVTIGDRVTVECEVMAVSDDGSAIVAVAGDFEGSGFLVPLAQCVKVPPARTPAEQLAADARWGS